MSSRGGWRTEAKKNIKCVSGLSAMDLSALSSNTIFSSHFSSPYTSYCPNYTGIFLSEFLSAVAEAQGASRGSAE